MRTSILTILAMIAHRMGAFSVFEWVTLGILLICCIIGDILTTDWMLKQIDSNTPQRKFNPFKRAKK